MITSIKGKASPPAPLRKERGVNGGMPPMITSMKGQQEKSEKVQMTVNMNAPKMNSAASS
ncbi:hypothetical protein J5A64_08200 [Prevotella denticola]|uniref:hypothetical protein n=1 Tax=Prevotella denticola TaxID=28129 RepID=UPI001BC85B84|nr:hypothetical protein [Prevotella denticola]QUI92970.1 hypothetical protein J5A64_08200 [Prevotella denticola]